MTEATVKLDLGPWPRRPVRRWLLGIGAIMLVAALAGGFFLWRGLGHPELDAGIAAARHGDDTDAITHYSAALDGKRLSAAARVETLNRRALAEINIHRDAAAIDDSSAAIAAMPDLAPAYSNRARAYVATGQIDLALVDYDVLLSLKPDDGDAHLARAQLFAAKGQDDKALPDENDAVRLLPKGAAIYAGRAATQARLGHLDEALADYDQAIALDAKNAWFFEGRGLVLAQRGQYKPAIDDFDAAVRLKPGMASGFKDRGAARLALGQFAEAAADLTDSVRLDPKDTYAVLWLHIATQRAGRDDKVAFAANATHVPAGRWPGPIVALFRDEVTPDQLREQGRLGNAPLKCHVAFYIGEYESLHDRPVSAQAALSQAAELCASLPEHFLAKAELARLGH